LTGWGFAVPEEGGLGVPFDPAISASEANAGVENATAVNNDNNGFFMTASCLLSKCNYKGIGKKFKSLDMKFITKKRNNRFI
jgi:hypothetical protein